MNKSINEREVKFSLFYVLKGDGIKLKCKKCGNEDLFYVKEKYSGTSNYVVNNFGEGLLLIGKVNNNAISKLRSVYYYCYECDNKISKIPQEKRY